MIASFVTLSGVLYAGLMITADGAKVLEYNCRLGDPETQVILPLLESDLYDVMKACVDGDLASVQPLRWTENSVAVGVVVCSGGYPGPCQKGLPITGKGFIHLFHESFAFPEPLRSYSSALCAFPIESS